jgi:hypothetical protein
VNRAGRLLRFYASIMLSATPGYRMPGGPADGPPSMYCLVCQQPAWRLDDHLIYCPTHKYYLLAACLGQDRQPCNEQAWRMPGTDWGCAHRHVNRGALCAVCRTVTPVGRSNTLTCAYGHRFRCDFETCAECNLGYFVAAPGRSWTCEAYGHDRSRGPR